MKASAKAGLEQFLTYRLHVLNKLAERGIGERYQEKLGVTVPEARVIASVGSFGPFSIMDRGTRTSTKARRAARLKRSSNRGSCSARQAKKTDASC
jgi:hypothetical protein